METVALNYPVEVAGQVYKELVLRRPKARDLLALEKAKGGDAEREARYFANLCEVSPDVISELDLADYKRLQETHQGFLS